MSFARFVLPLMCLAAVACSPAAPGGAQQAAGGGGAPSFSCDSPAAPLALGASAHGEIPAAQSYPDNARYFCVNVVAGASALTFDLNGMTTDLDLYIGKGSIGSVQGASLQSGNTYEWKSNAFGQDPEQVVIQNPEPGIYYAEVVSYQGQASSFDISAH